MSDILEVRNLRNQIKKQKILNGISFSIKENSFHGFIGENGAGKTTTMCFIASILNDYDGAIFFKDKLITLNSEKSILFIPERVSFPSHFTAFQFVDVFASIFLGRQVIKSKIHELFEEFNISDIKKRKANKLSSGQKKKISLIRAILSEPELLLIDEPAANLDPTSRFKLFHALTNLNKRGTTIFISSHIISELEKYVDSATFIQKGEIIWSGYLKNTKLSKKYEDIIIKGGEF